MLDEPNKQRTPNSTKTQCRQRVNESEGESSPVQGEGGGVGGNDRKRGGGGVEKSRYAHVKGVGKTTNKTLSGLICVLYVC